MICTYTDFSKQITYKLIRPGDDDLKAATKMSYKEVTHVICDLDGLLIDSETGYEKIMKDIAKQYGKEYTTEIRMKILGTVESETVRLAVQLMDLPISQEEFRAQYHEKVVKELVKPPLLPGAERLIRHLAKHRIPMAIATSGSKEITAIKLQSYTNLFSSFCHSVMGSSDADVKNGKPAPDIFLVCASRFPDKPNPEKCLVFEDAPNGVQAAVSAGMQVVMVPSPETNENLRKKATLVLPSLNEFKPELFGLPPFDD